MIDNSHTYQSNFEKLIVWQKSHNLTLKIYKITQKFPTEEKFSLIDQLRRSTSSIAANIVEGNEKKSLKEYIQFLYTAKSSLAETKYHLILSKDLCYLSSEDFNLLLTDINEIGKLLNGLISYLKTKSNHHP